MSEAVIDRYLREHRRQLNDYEKREIARHEALKAELRKIQELFRHP